MLADTNPDSKYVVPLSRDKINTIRDNYLIVETEYLSMGTAQPTRVPTGLLSNGERDFFRGESDVQDPDGYRRNARHRARKRMDQIEEDLEVLGEAGQADLVEEFYNRFGRDRRLEREIEELREQIRDSE